MNNGTPKYIDLQFSNAKVPGNHSQNGHFSRATSNCDAITTSMIYTGFIVESANKKVNDDEGEKLFV